MTTRKILIAVSAVLAHGCSLIASTPKECDSAADCVSRGAGFVCVEQFCVRAAAEDAGPTDSGAPDLGTPDAGQPDSGAVDTGPADTGVDERVVVVEQPITQNTIWRAGREYVLKERTIVWVQPPAKLTIEPGTIIKGEAASALVVARGATIDARGNAGLPIVFTSAKPAGQRARGDWGGLALLGNAPVNVTGETPSLEGVPAGDSRGEYGGLDPRANCGALQYVRIEFAGYEAFTDNELNGLTLAGCGTNTIVDHVQIHRGLDDGVEMFGGTVNLRNIVVSQVGDDSVDWSFGWRGNLQFLVAQQAGDDGDAAFEADNAEDEPLFDAKPRSSPTIFNATLVGSRAPAAKQRAMVLRRGTAGSFGNILMMGFPAESIDIRDGASVACITGAMSCQGDQLEFGGLLFYDIGAGGIGYFEDETATDDDGGFDERGYFRRPEQLAQFGLDPQLGRPYDLANPSFVPVLGQPTSTATIAVSPPQMEFFNDQAKYIGAFRAGEPDWTAQWTAYPQN